MKRVLVAICIFNCFWVCAQHSSKSPYGVGLKLGYLVHTLIGDLTKSPPDGNALIGLWFQLKMSKKWTAQPELLIIDKGIGGSRGGKEGPHWVNLHYLEIPLLFQYHGKNTYFGFGPGMGYLINRAEHLYGHISPDLVNKYPFSKSELSFNAGTGCTLNEKWTLGLRLSHSLLPVRVAVPSVSKASYNFLLALSVTRQLRKKKATDPQEQ